MKVLLHVPWTIADGFIGGTERFVLDLAKGLKGRGHRAFIVCSSLTWHTIVEEVDVFGRVPARERSAFIRHGSASERFFGETLFAQGSCFESLKRLGEYVAQQIAGIERDLCHLNGFLYASGMSEDTLDFASTVVTNHEGPEEMDNCWGAGAAQLLATKCAATLGRFAGLYTPSQHYAKRFSEMLGLAVRAVPLGVDLERCPVAMPGEGQRGGGAPVILMPARLEPKQKGQDIALEAFALLCQRGLSFRAVFTGLDASAYGNSVAWFWSEVSRLRLHGLVELRHYRDMRDAWNRADIVVSPERFCSFGLGILEALATGKHVVMSPIPTYVEISRRCRHAHVMAENSPACLAATIEPILEAGIPHPDSAEIKRFRREHSFVRCADSYLRLYASIVDSSAGVSRRAPI